MKRTTREGPELVVHVLDEDAGQYHELLDAAGVRTAGPQAPIWLAQPDLAAAALQTTKTPPEWIQSTWAGVRPLIANAAERGLTLTGLKDIFAPLISEYVFARLLSDATAVDRYSSAQAEGRWDPTWPTTLGGRQLCAIGTGSIGTHLAATARHFGMQAVGVSRRGRAAPGFDAVYRADAIAAAVADADVIVASLPDTDATAALIDASMLAACRPSAWFFNVGRAATVDHDALEQALVDRVIRRATIDLTPIEPLPPGHRLWRVPSLDITPHIAAVSQPRAVVAKFLLNLERFRNGESLHDRIDLKAGY